MPSETDPDRRTAYGVLVPVKTRSRAKSRLEPLGQEARVDLAGAFAEDTVTAALACLRVARVVAVTDDLALAERLSDLGAAVLPDGATDLNASLVQAAAELSRRHPGLAPAALCADLPALRPGELGAALDRAASSEMSFLADADGVGTTLVAAATVRDFVCAFGVSSRAAHLGLGAAELVGADMPSVRRDVDTPEDLLAALALGVGPRTAEVVVRLGLADASAPLVRS